MIFGCDFVWCGPRQFQGAHFDLCSRYSFWPLIVLILTDIRCSVWPIYGTHFDLYKVLMLTYIQVLMFTSITSPFTWELHQITLVLIIIERTPLSESLWTPLVLIIIELTPLSESLWTPCYFPICSSPIRPHQTFTIYRHFVSCPYNIANRSGLVLFAAWIQAAESLRVLWRLRQTACFSSSSHINHPSNGISIIIIQIIQSFDESNAIRLAVWGWGCHRRGVGCGSPSACSTMRVGVWTLALTRVRCPTDYESFPWHNMTTVVAIDH
jgi:hypothetical protein